MKSRYFLQSSSCSTLFSRDIWSYNRSCKYSKCAFFSSQLLRQSSSGTLDTLQSNDLRRHFDKSFFISKSCNDNPSYSANIGHLLAACLLPILADLEISQALPTPTLIIYLRSIQHRADCILRQALLWRLRAHFAVLLTYLILLVLIAA